MLSTPSGASGPAPSEFNLRAVARELLSQSQSTDPDVLAAELYGRIKAGQRDQALRLALRLVIRESIGQQRMAHPLPSARQMPSGPQPQSWKVRAVRDWNRSLEQRWHVGAGAWKRLADCTRDDLLFAANERQVIAEKNASIARSLNALAALLTDHDVETVAELPIEVQQHALGRVA